jgi:hypothetical protein
VLWRTQRDGQLRNFARARSEIVTGASPDATRPAARMRLVKRLRGERKEPVTDKDLYTAILGVLQSHFDSELPRPASQADFNDDAVVNNSGDANRAMLAHQIGQDAG